MKDIIPNHIPLSSALLYTGLKKEAFLYHVRKGRVRRIVNEYDTNRYLYLLEDCTTLKEALLAYRQHQRKLTLDKLLNRDVV